MGTLIDTFNTAVTETASETLGRHRLMKKPWVTADVLDLCDKRREQKKKKKDTEGGKQYRAINQEIKKSMKKAKETWIEEQCQDRREPTEEQKESVPAGARQDQHKTRANNCHTGHRGKLPHRKPGNPQEMNRVLLRLVKPQNHKRSGGPECPSSQKH